jgi:hypothetical protein
MLALIGIRLGFLFTIAPGNSLVIQSVYEESLTQKPGNGEEGAFEFQLRLGEFHCFMISFCLTNNPPCGNVVSPQDLVMGGRYNYPLPTERLVPAR